MKGWAKEEVWNFTYKEFFILIFSCLYSPHKVATSNKVCSSRWRAEEAGGRIPAALINWPQSLESEECEWALAGSRLPLLEVTDEVKSRKVNGERSGSLSGDDWIISETHNQDLSFNMFKCNLSLNVILAELDLFCTLKWHSAILCCSLDLSPILLFSLSDK